MPQDPLVTIVMCVYNAGAYLRPAVRSVLDQTYRQLEILIVDDGSTDGCMATIEDLTDSRIRRIRQENRGKPAAMNAALDQMNGEFYALNDADDLSCPTRIERQLNAMRQHQHVAAVYCGHDLLWNGRCLAPTFWPKDECACRHDIEMYSMPAHDPTGMYRMSMVRDVRYDEDLPVVEGIDYVLRIGERWPVMVLGECLYSYRIHWESLTKKNPQMRDAMVREAFRRACARRGADFDKTFPMATQGIVSRNAERDNGIATHFIMSACDLKCSGRRLEAFRVGIQCAMLHPTDRHYLKALVYAATPRSIVTASRRARHR